MRVTIQTRVDTREQSVDTAGKLFDDKGFEQTAIRDIALEAGLARWLMGAGVPGRCR